MSDELELCPFCDGLPFPETTITENAVRCTICGAKIVCKNHNDSTAFKRPNAIELWNTRAITPTAATQRHDNAELVERVARAINETANKQFNLSYIGKDESFVLAKAAIKALNKGNL